MGKEATAEVVMEVIKEAMEVAEEVTETLPREKISREEGVIDQETEEIDLLKEEEEKNLFLSEVFHLTQLRTVSKIFVKRID